ncbi:MAG: phage tail tape measure protein [Bacteroidales bacterium]
MSNNYTFTINISGNAATATQKIASLTASLSGEYQKLTKNISTLTERWLRFNQISEGVQRSLSGFQELSRAGMELDRTVTDLSALTGVTGSKLKEIEGYARQAAKTFGGSASQSVESYKLVLSQLGPTIANVPEALAAMGDNIATLSKTMGNDAVGAAEVLTTAMNQYGVSLDDPMAASERMAEMMNIMAAAAQAGSAELPAIKAALEQSGMAAKSAGVTFEELNAAIQVLDKAGKKASEGGVALRNVMATLSQGRFLPKDVLEELDAAGISVTTLTDTSLSLAERLDVLKPLMNDTALMAKMFGKENTNAAMALISATETISDYTTAVTGTTSAHDQAQVVMGSTAEKMSRFAAVIDNLKIGIFNVTKGMQPLVGALSQTLVPLSQMMPLIGALYSGYKRLELVIVRTASALGVYKLGLAKAVLGQKIYYSSLRKMTAAMGSAKLAATALNMAMLGIAGVVLGVVAAAITKIVGKYKEQAETAKEAAKESAESEKKYKETMVEARSEMSLSIAKLKDFKGSREDENRLVGEMNTKYGESFGAYQTVAQWYDILVAKSEAYCRKLVLEARIRDLANKAAESLTSAEDLKTERDSTPKQHVKTVRMFSLKDWDYIEMPETGKIEDNPAWTALDSRAQDAENKVKEYQATMEQLMKEVGVINADLATTISGGIGSPTPSGNTSDNATNAAKDKYDQLIVSMNQAKSANNLLGTAYEETLDSSQRQVESVIRDILPALGAESDEVRSLLALYREINGLRAKSAKIPTISNPAINRRPVAVAQNTGGGLAPERDAYGNIVIDQTGTINANAEALANYNAVQEEGATAGEASSLALSSLADAMGSLSGVVGESAAGWLTWGANLLQAISRAIPQIMALVAAEHVKTGAEATGAMVGAANSVANVPYVGPVLAIAAMASIAAAIMALPKFAEGGLAYGPTLGVFGEYAGASSNPEVVAPLNKLRTLIRPVEGNAYGEVKFEIEGRTLRGFLNKIDRIESRV